MPDKKTYEAPELDYVAFLDTDTVVTSGEFIDFPDDPVPTQH